MIRRYRDVHPGPEPGKPCTLPLEWLAAFRELKSAKSLENPLQTHKSATAILSSSIDAEDSIRENGTLFYYII